MSHRVRTHSWIDGLLHIKDRLFDELEEALGFAKEQDSAHSIKVYDDKDQVTHEISPSVNINTYA